MSEKLKNIPESDGDALLDNLRAKGRPDSKGHFSIDYEKKNARAWEMAQSIEGVLDKVGLEIICDAVRDVLGDIDKSKKPRKWNYPPEKELRDARARAEAARWAERLDAIIDELQVNLKMGINPIEGVKEISKTDVRNLSRLVKLPLRLGDHIYKGLIIASLLRELVPYRMKSSDVDPVMYAKQVINEITKKLRSDGLEWPYSSLHLLAISHPELDWMRTEISGYPIIRIIEVEVGGRSEKRIFEDSSARGVILDRDAKYLIGHPDYKKSPRRERLSFVILTLSEMGLTGSIKLEDIYRRAGELELELCPPDAGPNIVLDYSPESRTGITSDVFYIGMKPLGDSYLRDNGKIFGVEIYTPGSPRLNGTRASKSIKYTSGSRFVFVRPTVKTQ